MTVSTTTTKNSLSANGTLHSFAYGFKIFANADISVIVRSTTGTETVKTLDTHYVVTNAGNSSGGNVLFKFNTGTSSDAHFSSTDHRPANNETVVLARALTKTQGTDYVANDPFPAASHEDALDRLTMITQQIQEELDRTIKASVTNTLTGAEFTISATDRASKVFAFDSAGNLSVTQELGTARGNWAASTAYVERDIVVDSGTNSVFIVNAAHTSAGALPLTSNTNSAKYTVLVDASILGSVVSDATPQLGGVLASNGKDIAMADADKIIFGTNSDITISYDETTNDSLEIAAAVEGAALGIVLKADQGDDNADQWKVNIADGGVATINSKISGSFVSQMTLTPNATVASSTTSVAGNLTVGGSLTLGSGAVLAEAELEMIDGITAGTILASKAVVVDANKDVSSFRNLTASGAITGGSFVIGSADMSESDLEKLDGITNGTVAGNKAVVVDANKDASSFRNLTATGAVTAGSLVIGSADIAEAELEMLDGITAGTVAASKAVVVDANKDASSFRNLTASGAVTAGSLVIGSADIAEAELEMIDGITAGTALASKAMVLDSDKDITGGRNLTISGELDAGSLDISGDIDVDGTANLDVVDIDGAVNMATTALVTGVLTTTAATVFNGGFAAGGVGTFADGSAGAPSITNTGDVNTGIFFPAADTIAFAEGGAEAMRIDSSGNVGIGTTSPSSYYAKDLVVSTPDEGGVTIVSAATHTAYLMFADGTSGNDRFRGQIFYDHNVNKMGFATNAIERMLIDINGAVTMPAQPAFLAQPASTQSNIAINTNVTVIFATERFDVNADFASNVFTAPVAGKYQFNVNVFFQNLDEDANYMELQLATTNRGYSTSVDPDVGTDPVRTTMQVVTLADLDAGDTAFVRVTQSEGAAQADIHVESFFSGYLVA